MLTVDFEANLVRVREEGVEREYPLASQQAFAALSRAWLRCGWDSKYVYSFTWFGRPIIQLPEDLVRIQELIYRVQPDVIIETGIAHGGSLVFYASLCKAMGRGRVIGIDIEIRKHNRAAIEAHPLFDLITLVEGSSIDPAVVGQVRELLRNGETALIVLDSCHTKEHVLAELEAYAPLVSKGSYLVATDGIISAFHDLPNGKPAWVADNATRAAADFAAAHPEFSPGLPPRAFDESRVGRTPTYWPGAWLKRIR